MTVYTISKKYTLDSKTQAESKIMEKIHHANNKKKAEVVILISDKIGCKTKQKDY